MMRQVVGAFLVFLASAAAASAQAPAGAEFRVNTYTTGHQHDARSAVEPDGDFVVVWTSALQDGNGNGVFGQRFAASGAPRGSEFRINTYTTGYQWAPSAAIGSGGDFVVVWESEEDGSGASIHARRYDGSGSALGGEFLVNTFTTSSQFRARVGRASDGRFVVSWTSRYVDGSFYGIAARRFDALGSPIGSEFVVNTYTTGYQLLCDLAVEANGNFVVVWEDFLGNGDGSGSAIFGQRHHASGTRLGTEFLVNSYTTGDQRFPAVSVSPVGGFVVVWRSLDQDGSGYGVISRRFDASGNAIGNDFVVNTYTTGSQYGMFGPVAHDTRGNFVVTWTGQGDGDSSGAFAQRFSASGVPRGAEFRVNTYTTDLQTRPAVAFDAAGNFLVTWDSFGQDGSGIGIFAQRYGDVIFEDGFDSGALGSSVRQP